MKGAWEFHGVINKAHYRGLGNLKRGKYQGDFQHGNMYFRTGEHARGKTFEIFLVDGDSTLQVYGVIGGNPGWTEYYGWTRRGTWVKPILQYLRKLEKEIEAHDAQKEQEKREKQRESNKSIGQRVDKFNDMFRYG